MKISINKVQLCIANVQQKLHVKCYVILIKKCIA